MTIEVIMIHVEHVAIGLTSTGHPCDYSGHNDTCRTSSYWPDKYWTSM